MKNAHSSLPNTLLLVPLLLAAFLFLVGITKTDLWTPDEPRYAEVAREMLDRGNLLQPYCNGRPYTEKPPLFFWVEMLGAQVFGGVNQLAVRVPSALCALGTIALLIVFAREFLGKWAALIAATLLAVSPQFFWLARSGHIDMLLTLLVTAALVSFYRWYVRGKWGYLAIFYGGLTLATLAKGPVGLVLPLLIAAVFLLLRKDGRRIMATRFYVGVPIAVAVVLAWYLPAAHKSAGFEAHAVLWRQVIGRIFYSPDHGVSVFYWPFYQAVALAGGMAPWSALLPFAAVAAWRARADGPRLFLLVWAGVILAFFTLIASKRELYILPMYPAAAALLGLWLAEVELAKLKPLRIAVLAWGLLIAAGGVAVAVFGPGYMQRKFPEMGFPLDWRFALVCVAAGAAAVIAGRVGKRTWHYLAAGAGTSTVVFLLAALVIMPWIDTAKSPRHICGLYSSLKAGGSRLAMMGHVHEEYVFYANTFIQSLEGPKDLRRFFDTPGRMFCLASKKDWAKALEQPGFPIHVISEERVSSRVMWLLCNQRVAPDPRGKTSSN